MPAADPGLPPTVFVSPNQTEVAVSRFELRPAKVGFQGADLSLTNLAGRAVVAIAGQLELHWEGISEPVRLHHTAHSFGASEPLIAPSGSWHSPGIRVSAVPETARALKGVDFQVEYVEFEDGATSGPDRSCFGEYFREQKEEVRIMTDLREKLDQGWTEHILIPHLRYGLQGAAPAERAVFRRLLETYEQAGFSALVRSLE